MIEVDIYLTHNNTFSIVVKEGYTPVKLISTGVTRIVAAYSGIEIDSDEPGQGQGCFDWTTNGEDGVIEFDFSDLAVLESGDHYCTLVVYDPAHPDGQVWDDLFKMTVRGQVVT